MLDSGRSWDQARLRGGAAARLVLIGAAWVMASTLWAPAGGQTVFRTDTAVVALYATVRDRSGRLIPDLSSEAFEIVDDGVRVPISVFSNELQPITAVVMADMSVSMADEVPRLQQSLRYFIRSLRAGDRLRIGTFGKEVALSHALTDDRAVLGRVVAEELWPGGASPVWRAVDAAIRSLENEPGRQVVVMLTDGIDYSPGGTQGLPPLPGGAGALGRRAEANHNLLVYAIGFGDARRGVRLGGDILRLVRVTGGGHVDVSPDADLGEVLEGVGEELRRQYVVGFEPRHRDGKVHRVQLRVSVRGATVRTRETYVAPIRPSRSDDAQKDR
jgi:VWFA-related protein